MIGIQQKSLLCVLNSPPQTPRDSAKTAISLGFCDFNVSCIRLWVRACKIWYHIPLFTHKWTLMLVDSGFAIMDKVAINIDYRHISSTDSLHISCISSNGISRSYFFFFFSLNLDLNQTKIKQQHPPSNEIMEQSPFSNLTSFPETSLWSCPLLCEAPPMWAPHFWSHEVI